MSRIGKTPIEVPKGATVTVEGTTVVIKGPKGELKETLPKGVSVSVKNSTISVHSKNLDKKSTALHGLVRAKIANDIQGVTVGWTKSLSLSGVGYRANVSGANLVLTIGFSHPVEVIPPVGISFSVTEGRIVISGIDKYLVGQVGANIRAIKKPEPYKGKGISYTGEKIRKKAGKAAKAVGAVSGAPTSK